MARDTQDNEPLTFVTLAAATANVTRQLQKQPDTDRASDGEPKDREQQEEKTRAAYVDQRLRELAMFERRAAWKKNGARRN